MHSFQVTAADPYGKSASQSFTVDLTADVTPPSVRIEFASDPVDAGTPARILVLASDDVGVASLSLTVGGQHVALDSHGVGTVTEDAVGSFDVAATAADAAGNVGTATDSLLVIDPYDASAPVARIAAPADQADVTAPTDVVGSVSDSELISYSLAAAPLGRDTFTTFDSVAAAPGGTLAAITDGVLGRFDPTLLADGAYDIRLSATNAGGLTATDDRIVTVAGRLKLGNLHLAFTDLTIPLAGIPITITRTYDTLNANSQGDFGYGWTLSEGDFQLQVSQPDGSLAAAGALTPFTNGARVEITRPGQDPEGFTFVAQPYVSGYFAFQDYAKPSFRPDPGVADTLTVPDVDLIDNGDGTYSDAFGDPYNPADPAFGGAYTLTTHDGTAYTLDAATGKLATVADRDGDTLTYASDGIASSTGVKVAFHRTAQGLIDTITDPRGNMIAYGYGPAGDLVSVTDRDGNVTQFAYVPGQPHILDHVVDPSGRTVAQVAYLGGRVSGLTDANGQTTTTSYNLDALSETITPPTDADTPGGPSTVTFDARGDVAGATDALGDATSATYLGINLASQTETVNGRQLTTTYTYDAFGQPLTATDPQGRTTTFTYDAFGQPATSTDALGDTTSFQYDPKGNLLATTSPGGVTTSYTYYPDGQAWTTTTPDGTTTDAYYKAGDTGGNPGDLKTVTDPRGATTTYTYDQDGNQTSSEWTAANGDDLTTANLYDPDDHLVETAATDAATGAVVVADTVYDPQGRVVWSDDPHVPGQAHVDGTYTVYDSAGRVVRTEQDHDVVIAVATSSTTGVTTSIIASSGTPFSVSSTVYDSAGRVVWTDDPHLPGQAADGSHTIYDAAGRVIGAERYHHVAITLTTDPATGATTGSAASDATPFSISSTVYDSAGRAVWTDDPHLPGQATDGAHTTYDPAGRVESVERYHHVVIDISVNPPAVTSDPAPFASTSSTYDAAGRLKSTTDALGHTTSYVYDGDGRLIQTTDPDGSFTTVTYDAAGRKVAQTDPKGLTTTYRYDSLGDLTDVSLPAVAVAFTPDFPPPDDGLHHDAFQLVQPRYQYGYDLNGNLTTQTDPDNNTTTFTYDASGRKASETLPPVPDQYGNTATPTETWSYDALGRLASQTDFDGHVIVYAYDDQGRVTEKDEYDDQSQVDNHDAPTKAVTDTYDNYVGDSGLRDDTVTTPDDGTTSSYYDASGNLVEVDSPQGRIVYGYDAATGQKVETSTEDAGGAVITDIRYGYDPEGRLQTVTADVLDGNPVDLVATYAYDLANDLVTTDFPNGTVETRTYDALDRLKSVATNVGSATGPLVFSATYTLDKDGDRTSETDLPSGRVDAYAYDGDGRLIEEAITDPSAGNRTIAYTYDLAGNRPHQDRHRRPRRPGHALRPVRRRWPPDGDRQPALRSRHRAESQRHLYRDLHLRRRRQHPDRHRRQRRRDRLHHDRRLGPGGAARQGRHHRRGVEHDHLRLRRRRRPRLRDRRRPADDLSQRPDRCV